MNGVPETQEAQNLEVVWDLFLSGLSIWEIRWITPRELHLHDLFVAGSLSISDVEEMLSAAFSTT